MSFKIFLIIALSALLLSAPHSTAGVTPSGGDVERGYHAGENVKIQWTSSLHAGKVDVLLWDGDRHEFNLLASGIDAIATSYNWLIDRTIRPGDHYRFVVRDAKQPGNQEFSAGFVSISDAENNTVQLSGNNSFLVSSTPSPANDFAHISWSDAKVTQVELCDGCGIILNKQNVDEFATSALIDVSGNQSGLYFARLMSRNGPACVIPLLVVH